MEYDTQGPFVQGFPSFPKALGEKLRLILVLDCTFILPITSGFLYDPFLPNKSTKWRDKIISGVIQSENYRVTFFIR